MGKFSSFLERFPAEFTVHRRPGRDILDVPAGRPELLATAQASFSSSLARIRDDLFAALTRIPSQHKAKALYAPQNDAVIWTQPGEQHDDSAIELPETSLANELDIRRKFISEMQVAEQAKGALSTAISSEAPLRNFSIAIHSFGFVKQWHQFRLNILVDRLKNWSTEKRIQFRQNWVALSEPAIVQSDTSAVPVSDVNKRQLLEFANLLTDDELARIHIPMDIVLRVLAKR